MCLCVCVCQFGPINCLPVCAIILVDLFSLLFCLYCNRSVCMLITGSSNWQLEKVASGKAPPLEVPLIGLRKVRTDFGRGQRQYEIEE